MVLPLFLYWETSMSGSKGFKPSGLKPGDYKPHRKVNKDLNKWAGTQWGVVETASTDDPTRGVNLEESIRAIKETQIIEPVDTIIEQPTSEENPEASMSNRIPTDASSFAAIQRMAKSHGIQPVSPSHIANATKTNETVAEPVQSAAPKDNSLDEGYPRQQTELGEALGFRREEPTSFRIPEGAAVQTTRRQPEPVKEEVRPARDFQNIRPPEYSKGPASQVEESKHKATYIVDRAVTDKHIRVGLPSNFVPYTFTDYQLRPFVPRDLSRIYRAMIDADFSTIVDAIDRCGSVDARSFTPGDFKYLMYRQRLDSYPASPFEVPWKSRYGNDNKITVNHSNLNVIQLEITKEEFHERFAEFGLQFPTIRDVELIQANASKLPADEHWLFERVQFIVGSSFEEKMNRLDDGGIPLLELIREFQKHTEHGVEEFLMLRDDNFNLVKAIDYMDQELTRIENQLSNMDKNSQEYRALDMERYELASELKEMDTARTTKQQYLPREEKVVIDMNALQFFPNI